MSPIRIFACALAVAACAIAAAGEPPALASHNQVTYFEGSNILLNPAKRPRAIAQLRSRGVKALRVELYWRSSHPIRTAAPRRPSRPPIPPATRGASTTRCWPKPSAWAGRCC
jgi:hypothetical protein